MRKRKIKRRVRGAYKKIGLGLTRLGRIFKIKKYK